jgi:hypothetical protein
MTPEQLQIIQHALGVNEYGKGAMYRNHFCAGGKDEELCRQLVAMGYMRTWQGADEGGRVPHYPYYNCSVTETGKAAMLAESPKPPKLTRSQKRYRKFLDSGAGDCGYTFGEWLKRKDTA